MDMMSIELKKKIQALVEFIKSSLIEQMELYKLAPEPNSILRIRISISLFDQKLIN